MSMPLPPLRRLPCEGWLSSVVAVLEQAVGDLVAHGGHRRGRRGEGEQRGSMFWMQVGIRLFFGFGACAKLHLPVSASTEKPVSVFGRTRRCRRWFCHVKLGPAAL